MKGFYWGTGVVRCSFCGHRHHNITTCKVVDKYADLAMDKISKIPDYICTPTEHRALVELKRREQRKAKLKKPKKPPRCSYCGSLGHKRPKCELLNQFKNNVYVANKNWKLLFSKRVNEIGLGVGSLIKIDSDTSKSLGFNIHENNIAMITRYNLSNLNVFCALGDFYRKYQSNTTIDILSGDKVDNFSVKYFGNLLGYDLLNSGWWFGSGDPEVISPMPWTPDKAWLDSEWDEVFNWFFGDVKKNEVEYSGLDKFIEDWAKKD